MFGGIPPRPSIARLSSGSLISLFAAATARSPLDWPMPVADPPALNRIILTSADAGVHQARRGDYVRDYDTP